MGINEKGAELNTKLKNIGDAIRSKTGGTSNLTLDQMASEIANISGGGEEFNLFKYGSNLKGRPFYGLLSESTNYGLQKYFNDNSKYGSVINCPTVWSKCFSKLSSLNNSTSSAQTYSNTMEALENGKYIIAASSNSNTTDGYNTNTYSVLPNVLMAVDITNTFGSDLVECFLSSEEIFCTNTIFSIVNDIKDYLYKIKHSDTLCYSTLNTSSQKPSTTHYLVDGSYSYSLSKGIIQFPNYTSIRNSTDIYGNYTALGVNYDTYVICIRTEEDDEVFKTMINNMNSAKIMYQQLTPFRKDYLTDSSTTAICAPYYTYVDSNSYDPIYQKKENNVKAFDDTVSYVGKIIMITNLGTFSSSNASLWFTYRGADTINVTAPRPLMVSNSVPHIYNKNYLDRLAQIQSQTYTLDKNTTTTNSLANDNVVNSPIKGFGLDVMTTGSNVTNDTETYNPETATEEEKEAMYWQALQEEYAMREQEEQDKEQRKENENEQSGNTESGNSGSTESGSTESGNTEQIQPNQGMPGLS